MSDDSLPQPKTDFISCDQCGATYAAYRSLVCPHPIPRQLPISKQIAKKSLPAKKGAKGLPITVSVSIETAIAVIPKKKRGPKPKSGPRVFIKPYYEQQPWEKIRKGWRRWIAFSEWVSLAVKEGMRNYSEVGRRLGYTDSVLIERWAKEDQWPMRLDAYLLDKAEAERAEVAKAWKRRFGQVQVMGDSILTILAAEADAHLTNLKARAGSMTIKELNDSYIALGKFFELLQGRPTEHFTHDTPEMQRQEHLRVCAENIRTLLEHEKAGGVVSEEDLIEARADYTRLLAGKFKLPEELVSAAVDQLDRIEQQSDSVS